MERSHPSPEPRDLLEHRFETVTPCRDEIAGDGFAGTLPGGEDDRAIRVEFYPESQIARIHTPLADVTMRGAQLKHHADNDLLELSARSAREWTQFHLDSQGTAIFVSGSHRQHETATEPALTEATSRPVAEELSEGSVKEEDGSTTENEQERVSLSGRIGYKPQFRTTPKGTTVGSFSLAVHPAPGETEWHKVVTFGPRAEKLRDAGVGKGDVVEIVGYAHEREQTNTKTGETKMITEIYAAVVKRPKDQEKDQDPEGAEQGEASPRV